MATAPKIDTRDGLGSEQYVSYSTTQSSLIFTGVITLETVDVQVNLNGAGWVSDPTLIRLESAKYTVPNPELMPEGLGLEFGINTVELRAIDISGGVSVASRLTVDRKEVSLDASGYVPTGLLLKRRRNSVDVLAAVPAIPSVPTPGYNGLFLGFNFYASTAAGGATGYVRLNTSPLNPANATVVTEESTYAVVDDRTISYPLDSGATNLRLQIGLEDDFAKVVGTKLNSTFELLPYTGPFRTRIVTEEVSAQRYIRFRHDRNGDPTADTGLNADVFADASASDPLYYVVTGVYRSIADNSEFESPFSQEVVAAPLVIETTVKDLPPRVRRDIKESFVAAVLRSDTDLSLIPGSTTVDATIDPFSSESERVWFLLDFVHRAQSFLTLLQIDDANQDGVSDPVSTSAYKYALKSAMGFSSDFSVQQLIDAQFDKLAANKKKPRLPGRASVGQVVYYTRTRPTQNVPIPSGALVSTDDGIQFRVGGDYLLPTASADAFYSFDRQRYEVVVDITAMVVGEAGNVPAKAIKNVDTQVSGLQVENLEATDLGRGRESNTDLATRATLAFESTDVGTEGGYLNTAAQLTGIIKSKVVKSGDPLMMRDYDPVRAKHIGGKVDVYIQGAQERTVAERFAFSFDRALDITCQILDATTLTFKVLDARVTPDTPITQLLDEPSLGLGVRNVSKGQDYNLTGYSLLTYNTFRLNAALVQPVTAVDDVVIADYRYQHANRFSPTVQPIRRVISVTGEVAGTLPAAQIELYRTEDPLDVGESTIATNNIRIVQQGGVPSGASIAVSDEHQVLVGYFSNPLGSVGINPSTVRVFSLDRLVEYSGPTAIAPDFELVAGTATKPYQIQRTSASTILSGQEVSVDYEHDENFTVTYVVNDLLQKLQRRLDANRHITADVLAKQAVGNSIVADTTVQLLKGAQKDSVDPTIRTNVSLELNNRFIGDGAAQSDFIKSVDASTGVDYQIIPLARLGYADGSRKIRESVLSTAVRVPSLDQGFNHVFILTNPLNQPTTAGGGLNTEHRGVFSDDVAMALAETMDAVGLYSNGAYILGASGASIIGYSDDATLAGEGYIEIETERLRRTANHVLLSLPIGADPLTHKYAVSYVIRGDKGPHDFTASQIEFLELGDFTITFRGEA